MLSLLHAHRHAAYCLAFYLTNAFCYFGNLAIGFLFQLLEALCCVRNLAIGFLVQLLESRCAG
jgi:hypothetical protein